MKKRRFYLRCFVVLIMTGYWLCACAEPQSYSIANSVVHSMAENESMYNEMVDETHANEKWRAELFQYPSTSFNCSLALAAATFSEAAENVVEAGRELIYKLYDFEGWKEYHYDTSLFQGGALMISHDKLRIGGNETIVLVITARGTMNAGEMIGDFFHGSEHNYGGNHVWDNVYDFTEHIYEGLDDYVERYPEVKKADHLKVLITGHSLGGAAANFAGAYFSDSVGESDEWWSDRLTRDDVYVYTFGAIKVLETNRNVEKGYENIHNIYNYYDSFGPNGNLGFLNVSTPYAKFGHVEIYDSLKEDEAEDGISTNNHNMSSYIRALETELGGESVLKLGCSFVSQEIPDTNKEFSLVGYWRSVGDYGFGQAQPGTTIWFDEEHCSFYSPYDTYDFYFADGKYHLDCTNVLWKDTLSFIVKIQDNDHVTIYYGEYATELVRTE